AGGRSGGGRDPQEVDGEQVASDAARWIDELQALTDGGCVVSLPGAQADLDSVARVGEPSLTSVATDSDTVERVLGVETVPDVLVPASGTLDPATPAALGAGGSTALVADRSTRTDTGLLPPPGLVETTGPERTRALTYSSTLGASLAATGDVPENPRYSDPATRHWLTADSPDARPHDARAALPAPHNPEAARHRGCRAPRRRRRHTRPRGGGRAGDPGGAAPGVVGGRDRRRVPARPAGRPARVRSAARGVAAGAPGRAGDDPRRRPRRGSHRGERSRTDRPVRGRSGRDHRAAPRRDAGGHRHAALARRHLGPHLRLGARAPRPDGGGRAAGALRVG